VYSRTSENNMPSALGFTPLSEDEQREVDSALAL
jgi:hypothetical protein